MTDRVTLTSDKKPGLSALMYNLPGILAGTSPDVKDISLGFRTRLGFAVLSLIGPNFDQLGRGETGADGTRWPYLTAEYLAYGRRFGNGEKAALLGSFGLSPRKNNKGPGETKGLLTPDQLKLWKRTYIRQLETYALREPIDSAKAHAAAVAWVVVKKAGARTKLEVFGTRRVQMLVDSGLLRGSLQPGTIQENGLSATYNPPVVKGASEQVFDVSQPFEVVVGTNVSYAKYHHNGKRRLWPSEFPDEWWEQIIRIAISGLTELKEVYLNNV